MLIKGVKWTVCFKVLQWTGMCGIIQLTSCFGCFGRSVVIGVYRGMNGFNMNIYRLQKL